MFRSPMISNYSCKYLESTRPVYAIVSYRRDIEKRNISSAQFYTVPFQSTSKLETYNVISTYLHLEHAENMCKDLCKHLNVECEPEMFQLKDISYYANMMHVPVVVFINTYCDLDQKMEAHDIFYTARYLDHPNDYQRND